MSACSSATSVLPAASESASRRMAGAVVLSALLHTIFVMNLEPGSPGNTRIAGSRIITVRLEPAAAPAPIVPPADVGMPSTPAPARPRIDHARAPSTQHARDAVPEPAAAESAGVAPDSTYYAARQLDVYPALTTPLDLRYSSRAAAAGVQGRALVLLLIDANGIVDEVSIVEAEPAGYFEDDARRAFTAARFTPARKDGRAVKSRVLVRINYGTESAVQ